MNDRIHAGVSALAACFVGATLLVRWAVTGGQSGTRERRPRPVEEFVPAHHLIPALAYGAAVAQTVAYCRGCRASVPVTVHGDATRCDQGHLTIHTTTGSAL